MNITFMNDSGRAVLAISKFYKILPQQIIVAYDDYSKDDSMNIGIFPRFLSQILASMIIMGFDLNISS